MRPSTTRPSKRHWTASSALRRDGTPTMTDSESSVNDGHVGLVPTGSRTTAVLGWLLVVALSVAALSYWLPWVGHHTSALTLTGQDLGEFVKFLPAIRRGHVRFPRQAFYLPPLACSVSLVLLSINRQLPYPRWLRVGLLALSLLLLPGLLPPAWGHPRELLAREFRLQAVAVIAGFAVVLAHGLFRRLSLCLLGLLVGGLALIALVPSQIAFWAIRPHIWDAYGTPTIWLGWGLWLGVVAWLAVIGCAAALVALDKRRKHRD